MKKILFTIGCLLILLGVVVGVLYFLPNELSFKIYNARAINAADDKQSSEFFQKASKAFPQWQLISQNNEMGRIYEQKQYEQLQKELSEELANECNIEQEEISEFCENIFYLDGLVQYRLGENLQDEEQKEYFQKAINSFQKTLTINNENTWAQENIDFILQKSTQQDQQQQNDDGDSEQGQDGEQEGQDSQSQDEQEQDGEQGEGQDDQGQQGNEQQGEQEGGQDSQGGAAEGQDGDDVGESRLPQKIQDALEQAQEEMEQDQGQEGFNRSQSAAEKNNYSSQDPLEQMMQQFFGINPQSQQKNFTQDIQDPNEKDW